MIEKRDTFVSKTDRAISNKKKLTHHKTFGKKEKLTASSPALKMLTPALDLVVMSRAVS